MTTTRNTLSAHQARALAEQAATAGDASLHGACVRLLDAYAAQPFGWPTFIEFLPEADADLATIVAAINAAEGLADT